MSHIHAFCVVIIPFRSIPIRHSVSVVVKHAFCRQMTFIHREPKWITVVVVPKINSKTIYVPCIAPETVELRVLITRQRDALEMFCHLMC